MRLSRLLVFFGICFASLTGMAQRLPITNDAAKLCQDKKYPEALRRIDEAKKSEMESIDPYMWYVDGFIHKEIYKESQAGVRNSSEREIAVESFLKSLNLDKRNENITMNRISLKFLASSYYNDALLMTQEFVLANEKEPEIVFNKFRKLMHYAEPGTSLKKYDKEFNKSMGQRYFALWELDIDNEALADKAVDCYSNSARLDSTENDAFYNIAVVYYNRAVFKYRKIGVYTDIFDLMVTQEECAELIRNKALPNMQKAYALSPERGDIIRGLMFIHKALEHENDVEYFKNEIERLVKEGKIIRPDK